jgi:hypothetical protein
MKPLTLHLTLYRQYFDAILAGTKNIEYRRRSERYDQQFKKPYTHIKFINGYGHHRPWLLVEIKRFEQTPDQWLIHLGNVLSSGNIDPTLFS